MSAPRLAEKLERACLEAYRMVAKAASEAILLRTEDAERRHLQRARRRLQKSEALVAQALEAAEAAIRGELEDAAARAPKEKTRGHKAKTKASGREEEAPAALASPESRPAAKAKSKAKTHGKARAKAQGKAAPKRAGDAKKQRHGAEDAAPKAALLRKRPRPAESDEEPARASAHHAARAPLLRARLLDSDAE